MLIDGPTSFPNYNNAIFGNWVQGDSRQFLRNLSLSLLETGDLAISAYLTIKASPTQTDQNAVLQIPVVTIPSVYGSVGPNIGGIQLITINVPGNLVAVARGKINPAQVYYYDIKVFTQLGTVWTGENGAIQFVAQVGDVDITGIPLQLTGGTPSFRGYAIGPPPNSGPIFFTGDWIRNSQPIPGSPSGWVCLIGGSPGTWADFGIVGNDSGIFNVPLPAFGNPSYQGFTNGPPLMTDTSPTQGDWSINLYPIQDNAWGWAFNGTVWLTDSFIADSTAPQSGTNPIPGSPPTFWGFAYGPPISGAYNWGDWAKNILPTQGSPSGWVCTQAGSPGIWMSDGIIGQGLN
jgi:hypothetical protein